MQIQIRFAELIDHHKIAELSENIFQSVTNKSFFSWDRKNLYDELKTKALAIVAVQNENILGFIVFRQQDETLDVMTLGTSPGHQRLGIMSQLLDFMLKYAANENKKIMLEVHAANCSAIELYQKKGFQIIYKRERYYKDGAAALIMSYSCF